MRRKIGYKVQSKNKTTSNNDNPLFQLQNSTLKQLWTMKVERDQPTTAAWPKVERLKTVPLVIKTLNRHEVDKILKVSPDEDDKIRQLTDICETQKGLLVSGRLTDWLIDSTTEPNLVLYGTAS